MTTPEARMHASSEVVDELADVAESLDLRLDSLLGTIVKSAEEGGRPSAGRKPVDLTEVGQGEPEPCQAAREEQEVTPLLSTVEKKISTLSEKNGRKSPIRGKVSRRGVTFAPSELNRVWAYEVDNSVYLAIEYSRPLIGWIVLVVAVLCDSIGSIVQTYLESQKVLTYAAATWTSIGEFAVAIMLLAFDWLFGGVSPHHTTFVRSSSGMLLIISVCVLFFLYHLAEEASIYLTQRTRAFTLTGVHPLLIALLGKLFKGTLFKEEIAGGLVLIGGYALCMLPNDVNASHWQFSTVLALSQGVYLASFLFMCMRARAKVPLSLIFALLVTAMVVFQLLVCCIVSQATFSADSDNGVFGFTITNNVSLWMFSTLCAATSLVGYLSVLRFLPAMTVSAVMTLKPLLVVFGSHIAFYTGEALWKLDASHEERVDFNFVFSVGCLICVAAAMYITYISSIKRQKVEMLLKTLSRRKTPKNPYQRKSHLQQEFPVSKMEISQPVPLLVNREGSQNNLDSYYDNVM